MKGRSPWWSFSRSPGGCHPETHRSNRITFVRRAIVRDPAKRYRGAIAIVFLDIDRIEVISDECVAPFAECVLRTARRRDEVVVKYTIHL